MTGSGDRAARPREGCAPTAWVVGRSYVLPVVAVLLATTACGNAEPEGGGGSPGETVAVATEAAGEEPRDLTFQRALVIPDSVFAHGEHRTLDCRTCHEEVPTHLTHQGIECTECHGLPEDRATRPTRSRGECLACHHQRVVDVGCERCHAAGGPSRVRVEAAFGIAGGTISREVAFDHDRHGGLDCSRCHERGVILEVERGCASCHEVHHEAESPCLSCHEDGLERHEIEAHRGCSGGGCHTDPVVLALPRNRSLCLSCHSAVVDHMPNRDCVECHRVAPSGEPRDEVGGG